MSDRDARQAAREARWAERDEFYRLEAERRAARLSIFVTDANGTVLELVPTDPMEVFIAGDGERSIRAVDGPLYRITVAPGRKGESQNET